MTYGIEISSAIGSNDLTDLTSFRVFDVQLKTESVTTAGQTFTYTAPSGWSSSNGTFYVVPNSSGVMPAFSASGSTITATFQTFNSLLKANSWRIFWLVKTGTDAPSGYGFLVSNGSAQTVLSDTTETLLASSSGTLTSYTTTNTGMRQFSLPSGFDATEDALFVKLTDNSDFFATSRNFYSGADDFKVNSTTETSLQYFVVSRSFSLAAPTSGYGIAVFSNGSVVYTSEYDIFPSNGQTLVVDDGASTTVNTSKDVWVNLQFATPAPFCPFPGNPTFPTFNFVLGLERSGATVSEKQESVANIGNSNLVSNAHDNTALIVQR